jgi:hypothetical protein
MSSRDARVERTAAHGSAALQGFVKIPIWMRALRDTRLERCCAAFLVYALKEPRGGGSRRARAARLLDG